MNNYCIKYERLITSNRNWLVEQCEKDCNNCRHATTLTDSILGWMDDNGIDYRVYKREFIFIYASSGLSVARYFFEGQKYILDASFNYECKQGIDNFKKDILMLLEEFN